jgi:hypothetical protein
MGYNHTMNETGILIVRIATAFIIGFFTGMVFIISKMIGK